MAPCSCTSMVPYYYFKLLLAFVVLLTTANSLLRPSIKSHRANNPHYASNINNLYENFKSSIFKTSLITLNGLASVVLLNSQNNKANAIDLTSINDISTTKIITRDDVGFVNLNETFPKVTDVAWMDIKIGEGDPQRVEISLFGERVV